LFDWRTDNRLKYSSATGIYSANFEWKEAKRGAHIYLDLGQVYFTAEVLVNGRQAGTALYSPYMLDITEIVKTGPNVIEIRVTPGALNSFIGKAKAGDSRYKSFKNKDDQLMAARLLGPVVIRTDR
jgi:hypothetical protein